MNFGNTFQDFCEINRLTKQEAIRILENELKIRSESNGIESERPGL